MADLNSTIVRGNLRVTEDINANGNVTTSNSISAGSFIENGTSLANKYLGKTAKAADADKLDGNDSSYYLNYSATGQAKSGNLTLTGNTYIGD